MKSTLAFMISIICLLPICSIARAAEGVTFDVSASRVQLTLQDTLVIAVSVTISGDDSNFDVSEPQAPELQNFEHISSGSSSKRVLSADEPTVIRTTRHLYKPLAPGTALIPSMSLDYVDKRSGNVSTLRSSEIRVVVADTSGGLDRVVGLIVLAVIVAIVVAASLLVYLRMQRKRIRIVEESKVDRHAEEAFAESLSRAGVQLAHGRRADAQTGLTEAIFAYVLGRYGLDLRGKSGRDVAKAMDEVGAPNQLIDIMIKLMDWSESLKFSGLSRSEVELKELIAALQQIVELSHP